MNFQYIHSDSFSAMRAYMRPFGTPFTKIVFMENALKYIKLSSAEN